MLINDKNELKKALIKYGGKISVNDGVFNINGVTLYDCDIAYIYMGEGGEDLVELCDKDMMTIIGVRMSDIVEFEQVCEYDEEGYII